MTLQQHSDLAMPQFSKNPQHLKVLKHFVYPIWMWDAVNGGF